MNATTTTQPVDINAAVDLTKVVFEMPTLSMTTMKSCLREYLLDNQACFIWGAPGIGKTGAIQQVVQDELGWPCHVNVLNSLLPEDMTGMPQADMVEQVTRWMKPAIMPTADVDSVWFIDEANTNNSAMMPIMFRLVQERYCGVHKLPSKLRIVMAGNRTKDRASAQKLPTPLRNKLAHLNVEPDLPAFLDWAYKVGLSPFVTAFLQHRPMFLHIMPPTDDVMTFPTPRVWEKIAVHVDKPLAVRQQLIGGLVGNGIAAEFEGFLRIFSQMPCRPADALKNPKSAPLPDEKQPALCYAMASAIARTVDRKSFAAGIEYVSRFKTREFEVATVMEAVKRNVSLAETDAYGVWHVNNQDVTW